MNDGPMATLVALQRLQYLAKREGIDPDTPLGQWMAAMQAMTVGLSSHLAQVGSDARAAVQASADAAAETRRHTQNMVQALSFKTDQLEVEFTHSLAPAVAQAVGRAVVIREQRRSTGILALSAAALATAMVGMVAGGWFLRGATEQAAIELKASCDMRAFQGADGQRWCPLGSMAATPSRGGEGRR